MKANELMIGDWVMYNPNVFIEDEYETAKEWFPTQINSGEDIDLAIEGCYTPIPLTTEILEKNGFEVTRNMSSSGNKDVWSLRVSKNKVFHIIEHHNKRKFPYFWIELGSNSDIKYVHQLQHALRLCGVEKTIEL